jgi:signal peptidase II
MVIKVNFKAIIFCCLLVLLDQLAKAAARGIQPLQLGFLSLGKIGNTGSIFGLFPGTQVILIFLSFVLVSVLIWYYPRLESQLQRISVLLIISGIAGNAVDRIFFGTVTDFIWLPFWPAFNFADSFISIGVVLMLYSMFFQSKK